MVPRRRGLRFARAMVLHFGSNRASPRCLPVHLLRRRVARSRLQPWRSPVKSASVSNAGRDDTKRSTLSAATHCVIKHSVALFPGPHLLVVRNVVQDRGVAIFPVEWAAHQRPEHTRNRRAIDDRTSRCNPDNAIRIGITQFTEQRHVPAIIFPAGFNLSAVITPRMFFASGDGIPCGRLMSAARG